MLKLIIINKQGSTVLIMNYLLVFVLINIIKNFAILIYLQNRFINSYKHLNLQNQTKTMIRDYKLSTSSKKLQNDIFRTDNNEQCKKYNHNWVKIYPAEGETYTECSACGTKVNT